MIYDYCCTECGHMMEVIQKFVDPQVLECPNCGSTPMVKQVGLSSFRLKGSGWYATENKKS